MEHRHKKNKIVSLLNVEAGFSLMETIGVLAIIAICVGVMVPPILEKISDVRRTAESNDLYNITEALKEEILAKKYIPSANDWASFISQRLGLPPEKINISRRTMVVDPLSQIFSFTGKLPYTQTTNGTLYPNRMRIMFLSNLSFNPNSLPIPTDFLTDVLKFQLVWDTPEWSVPPFFGSAWIGKGKYLKIQRIDLASLFRRLVIQVRGSGRAYISIDGSQPFSVPSMNRYYFKGTVVGFYDKTGTKLLEQDVLDDDALYIFDGLNWSTDAGDMANSSDLEAIGQMVDSFLNVSTNPDARFGAAQKYLINDLYNFMLMYSRWAADGFSDYGSNNDQQVPENQALEKTQQRIDDSSSNLIW